MKFYIIQPNAQIFNIYIHIYLKIYPLCYDIGNQMKYAFIGVNIL
jgi:hypothetical protein